VQSCYIQTHTHTHTHTHTAYTRTYVRSVALLNPASPTGGEIIRRIDLYLTEIKLLKAQQFQSLQVARHCVVIPQS